MSYTHRKPHPDQQLLQALEMAGDEDIVEAQMVVQDRRAAPSKYLFRLREAAGDKEQCVPLATNQEATLLSVPSEDEESNRYASAIPCANFQDA